MDDDVGVDDVVQVVDGLLELVGRVVVDEPVVGVRRDVVDDLGHELAVARAVAVEVAPGEPVVRVERLTVLARDRRQLAPRERVEPRGRPERLVEHRDPDAGAALAARLQRVGADARHPLRGHRVGGRRVARGGERRLQERAAPGTQRAGEIGRRAGPRIRRGR